MAARLPSALRAFTSSRPAASTLLLPRSRILSPPLQAQRTFQTSRRRMQDAVVATKKPVGAFRGTLFGFLLGSVLAGAGLYYYVIDEYKVSNELLTEDIYALQAAVQRIEVYVKSLEEQVPKK